MNRKEAYDLFLKTWGYDAQARMAIEEMSELTKELCKLERYKDNKEKTQEIIKNIIEETADVLNVVEQLSHYYGEEEVERVRDEKIERALKRARGL